jgi:hypothetical protein
MFRSSTIIRELVLNLAKVMLKHSVKLRRYHAVVRQHAATQPHNK